MHQDPGQRHPGHRVHPAARRGRRHRQAAARPQPLDDVGRHERAARRACSPGTLDAGTIDGKLYGLLVSANVKGLIFYPKKAWDAAGYTAADARSTDLDALTDQIKADGNTPWCMGIESDTATGWPATDWFETLIMQVRRRRRLQRVGHPQGQVRLRPRSSRPPTSSRSCCSPTATRSVAARRSPAPTSAPPATRCSTTRPGCWMYKQGSFITGFFPKDVLRPTSTPTSACSASRRPPPAATTRSIGGGDLATMLNDNDNAKTVMKDLSRDRHRQRRGRRRSSFISPHKDFDASLYPNEIDRRRSPRSPTTRRRSCSTVPTRCRARSARARSGRT